jgi:predicted ATPase
MAYDACCLWCLGYPDQALRRGEEALAQARALDHAFSLAEIILFVGCLLNEMRRDAEALKAYAEELMQLASESGMPTWLAMRDRYRGSALAMLGQVEEGIALMREGIELDRSRGVRVQLGASLCSLATAQATAGRPEDGLTTLAEALGFVDQSGERIWEAEMHRVRGELLRAVGDESEADASFLQAIDVARRQQAKSWELRAATSLARLWLEVGKTDDARRMLAEVYDWFTEGFDTPDLREAEELLGSLA